MGVHGLWQLLNSTGKPVPLETLEGKVLAVDVSVWLHQLSKGMRDSHGNPLPHAHLHGLFTRICKLLYYRIKPVFVFDGGVPALKKETLAVRRSKRDDAEKESERMQRKILSNLIRSEVVKQSLGLDVIPKALSSSKPGGKKDMLFELPPLPETSEAQSYIRQDTDPDDSFEERREALHLVEQEYGDITKIDVDSEEFLSLPTDIQHEIITDVKERRKNYNLSRTANMPDDSKEFSNFQVAKLLKQSKLSSRLDEVRKELNSGVATDWRDQYGSSFRGGDIQSRRVISDDASHFILVKGVRRKSQENLENVEHKSNLSSKSEYFGTSDGSGSNTDELLHENEEERETTDFSQSDQRIAIGKVVIGEARSGDTIGPQQLKHGSKLGLNGQEKCVSARQSENAVYRPVIEIETDSDSDSQISDASEINVREKTLLSNVEQSNNFQPGSPCIVIDSGDDSELDNRMDDIQANRDLQLAIEESLNYHKATHVTNSENINTTENSGAQCLSTQSLCITAKTDTCVEKTSASEKSFLTNTKSLTVYKTNSHKPTSDSVMSSPGKSYKEISDLKKESSIFKRSISLISSQEDTFVSKKPRQAENLDKNNDLGNVVKQLDRNNAVDIESMEGELAPVVEIASDEGESSDDDFIEVTVDAANAKPDDLFPASIFETNVAVSPSNHSDSSSFHSDQSESGNADVIDLEKWNLNSDDYEKELDSSSVPDVTQSSATVEPRSPNLPDIVSGIESPEVKVPDLVRDFQFLNENNVRGMRAHLSDEARQLRQEKGRQDRLATSITDQMHSEAQALLRLFGIPYIVSPTEAEAQCAQLELVSLTHGTITDDSDIWLFGGKCVYKNFFNMAKHVECYRQTAIASEIGLTRQSLINLALLCGSDYTAGIQGVGPVTAMEILAEFPGDDIEGLETLKLWWEEAQDQLQIPTESKLMSKLRELDISPGFPNPRVVAAYMEPTVDESREPFSWSQPDLGQLREFNSEKLGWSHEKTDKLLLPVMKQLEKKEHQRRISSFFQPEIHIQPAKMKSKRLQKVVTKFLNPDTGNEAETALPDTAENTEPKGDMKGNGRGRGRGRLKKTNKTVVADDDKKHVNKTENDIEVVCKDNNYIDVPTCIPSENYQEQEEECEKSKYFQKNVKLLLREENVSNDSSDNTSSFSEDSSADSSSGSDSNEEMVVEAGLNVAEILNMKMGDGITDAIGSQISKNMETVLGDGLDDDEHKEIDSDIDNEVDNFEMDGGFIRDSDFDSDFEFEVEHQAKKAKLTDDQVSVTEHARMENAKPGEKKTVELGTIAKKFIARIQNSPKSKIKTVAVNARQISNQVSSQTSKHVQNLKFGVHKNNDSRKSPVTICEKSSKATCDLNEKEKKTRTQKKDIEEQNVATRKKTKLSDKLSNRKDSTATCEKQPDKKKDAIPNEADVKSDSINTSNEPIRTSVSETHCYTSDPIKTIVSGLPWTSKTKKKNVGVKRKGRGINQGKGRQLEPVEKLGKKVAKQVSVRKPVGVVNLSESSSDDG